MREPSRRFLGASLLRRALVWRAGSSVAFLAVAIIAVGAAAAGPVYLAAADQSVLTNVLSSAAPDQTGLGVFPQPGTVSSVAVLERALAHLPLSPGSRPWWGRPIYTADLGVSASLGSGEPVGADLVWRSGICHHLHMTVGRCPAGGTGVAVSSRTARYMHARVGSVLDLSGKGARGATAKVIGIYSVVDASAPYYWGVNYFPFGTGSEREPRVDSFFASKNGVLRFEAGGGVAVSADVPLAVENLRAPDVPTFLSALSGLETRLGGTNWQLSTSSPVGGLLSDAEAQEQAMATSVAVIDLELMILVLIVLYGVSVGTSAAREHDLALGDLRGLSPPSLAALAVREPFVLLVAAAPIGAFLGWLTIRVISPLVLSGQTTVPFDSLAVLAALAAVVAGLLASIAGSVNLLRRSAGAAAITRPRRRTGRAGVVLDAFAVALAAAAIVELDATGVTGGTKSSPLATLAPGLVALALGVLAARLVPLVCRLTARLTTDSPRVATHVALQRVARRSTVVRQVIVMAIAVSLVYFSAAAFVVARHNRTVESQFRVGSGQVLSVAVPGGSDLVPLVDRADPSGRLAMAGEQLDAPSGNLLALDMARFAHVAAWPGNLGGLDARQVGSYLHPRTAPPVFLSGQLVRVRVDLVGVTPHLPPSKIGPVDLSLALLDPRYMALEPVTLGPLRPGAHEYSANVAGTCDLRCRLVSIGIDWTPPASSSLTAINVSMTLESLAADARASAGAGAGSRFTRLRGIFSSSARWRPSGANARILAAGPSGLLVNIVPNFGGASPAIEPADVPVPLPAVVTDEVVAANAGSGPTGSTTFPAENLDGNSITVDGRVQVPALPRVGTNGALVDLTLASRLMTAPGIYATDEVWISSSATPPEVQGIVARLSAEGVTVVSTDSAARLERQYDRAGPSLAFILFLLAGAAAALLAAGSLLFAVASSARRRSVELVALGAAGVPSRKLVGALFGELSIVALAGLVAGIAAGAASAGLALRAVPEFTHLGAGPSLVYEVPAGIVAVAVAALACLFLLVVCAGTVAVRLKATEDLLRFSDR